MENEKLNNVGKLYSIGTLVGKLHTNYIGTWYKFNVNYKLKS